MRRPYPQRARLAYRLAFNSTSTVTAMTRWLNKGKRSDRWVGRVERTDNRRA